MNDPLAESLRDSMVNWLEAEDNDEDEEMEEEEETDTQMDGGVHSKAETCPTIVTPMQTNRRTASLRKKLPIQRHAPIFTTNVVFPNDADDGNNAKKRKHHPETNDKNSPTKSTTSNGIDFVKGVCNSQILSYVNSQTAEEQNEVVDDTLQIISDHMHVTPKLEAYVRSLLTTQKFEMQLHETDHSMVRQQLSELADDRAKDMPADTYKIYNEIKSDPRCQSTFFPCKWCPGYDPPYVLTFALPSQPVF